MRNPGSHSDPMAEKRVLVVGGCHGTCLLIDADDDNGTGRRQIVSANCLVLAICLAIAGLVSALAWI
jgi:hypothetical protein